MKTPILFIVFNRPDTTIRVWDAIREAKPERLFVAADGPRVQKSGEVDRCLRVRDIVKNVDWKCEVQYLFRDENIGCGKGVRGAINWFFDNVDEGIILEDDILPNCSFFPFAEEMLVKYRYNDRIGTISGSNLWNGVPSIPASYFFSRHVSVWGWATWKRSWDRSHEFYDRIARRDPILLDLCTSVLASSKRASNFRESIKSLWDGLDTWDYQWCVCNYAYGSLVVRPIVNLTANIGFGVDATHTQGESPAHYQVSSPLDFPLKHPEFIVPDYQADEVLENWWLGSFFSTKEKFHLRRILGKWKTKLFRQIVKFRK